MFDRIQDRHGKTILRHDTRPCVGCVDVGWNDQPCRRRCRTTASRSPIRSPPTRSSRCWRASCSAAPAPSCSSVGKPLAGKTGTTNDSIDAWFVGFSPDLVVGVWVGFDQPRTLGQIEQGATAAAPIFRDFMTEALDDKPATPFRVPPGIRLVRVDEETGAPAQPGDQNVILEAFKPGTEPTLERRRHRARPTRSIRAPARHQRRPGPASGATGGLLTETAYPSLTQRPRREILLRRRHQPRPE